MGRIGLQSIRGGTKLLFNCQLPNAIEMTKSYINNLSTPSEPLTQMPFSASVSIEQDMLYNNSRRMVNELQELKKGSFAIVLATVKYLTGTNGWWYMACNVCTRGVFPDNKMYFCEKCWTHVIAVGPRYCVRIKVFDETDEATIVIFDREATTLFGKSCSEMIEGTKEGGDDFQAINEIKSIMGKKFLFKIESKPPSSSAFEPSFNVKKMTDDPNIIDKFLEMNPRKNLLEDFSQAASTPMKYIEGSEDSQFKRSPEPVCDLSASGSFSSSFNKKMKGIVSTPEGNIVSSSTDTEVNLLETPTMKKTTMFESSVSFGKKKTNIVESSDSSGKEASAGYKSVMNDSEFKSFVIKKIKKEKL